jgi:hypothetical protein
MNIEQFIFVFPLTTVGLAAATSLISFRYDYPLALRQLSILWAFNFCADLAGYITRSMGIRNLWIYNINFWILYMALAYLYRQQIRSRRIRAAIGIFYFIFPPLVIINCWLSGINDLQTVIIVAGGAFIVFLAAAYFRQLYISDDSDRITRDPWFWFSFGFLIQFGGTLPFLGMLNYLWQHYPQFTRFYYLYFSNAFTILLNILIIVGFLCRRNYQKSR